jgi:hypothetical protein
MRWRPPSARENGSRSGEWLAGHALADQFQPDLEDAEPLAAPLVPRIAQPMGQHPKKYYHPDP